MNDFTIHTLDTAPESVRPILQTLQQRLGFVPNLAATMAGVPPVLEAFAAIMGSNARTSFSPVEREIISMVAAREIGCTYCMAAHSTFAKAQGADDSLIAAVRAGKTPSDPKLAALTTFAHQVVCQQGQVSDEDAAVFRSYGFSHTQQLEVLVSVVQVTLVNLVQRMAGTPLDAGFQPQAWSAS